jgi:hypothetical protein
MFKKIPAFALWMMLALAVALVPLACSSSSSTTPDATTQQDTGSATHS